MNPDSLLSYWIKIRIPDAGRFAAYVGYLMMRARAATIQFQEDMYYPARQGLCKIRTEYEGSHATFVSNTKLMFYTREVDRDSGISTCRYISFGAGRTNFRAAQDLVHGSPEAIVAKKRIAVDMDVSLNSMGSSDAVRIHMDTVDIVPGAHFEYFLEIGFGLSYGQTLDRAKAIVANVLNTLSIRLGEHGEVVVHDSYRDLHLARVRS